MNSYLRLSGYSKLRDGFLNGEIFHSIEELGVLPNAGASTITPSDHTPRWGKNTSTGGPDDLD